MSVNTGLLNSISNLSELTGAGKTSKADMKNMSNEELSAFGLDVIDDSIDTFEKSTAKTEESEEAKTEKEKQEEQKKLQEQIEAMEEAIKQLNQQIASMPDGDDKAAMQEELSGLEEQLNELISKLGGGNSSSQNDVSGQQNNVSAQPSSDMEQYLENYKQSQLSDLNSKAATNQNISSGSATSGLSNALSSAGSIASNALSSVANSAAKSSSSSGSVGNTNSAASTGSSNDVSANSVMAKAKDSNQSWGDYWKSQGYNEDAGKTLASAAKNKGGAMGTKGRCATGVAKSYNSVYGTSLHGNGEDWDENMRTQSDKFKELDLSNMSNSQISELVNNLPAGAVVSWEGFSGGTSSAFAQYGHVTIADGNGGEYSDHYSSKIYDYTQKSGFSKDKCAIFIPV